MYICFLYTSLRQKSCPPIYRFRFLFLFLLFYFQFLMSVMLCARFLLSHSFISTLPHPWFTVVSATSPPNSFDSNNNLSLLLLTLPSSTSRKSIPIGHPSKIFQMRLQPSVRKDSSASARQSA